MATTEAETFWDMRAFTTDILGDPTETIRDGRFETHRWVRDGFHRVSENTDPEDIEVILHGPTPVNLLLVCSRDSFKALDKDVQRMLLAIVGYAALIGCPNEAFDGEFLHG